MSKIYYDSCFSHLVVDPIFKWIWKCACTLKFKVFGWLLLMDRLNTRDMMQRPHWIIQDDTCAICNLAQHEDRAIFSLVASLVNGFGTILGYLGPFNRTKPHMRWLKQLGGISVILFSLRLSSLLLGIFGHKGMGRSSEMSNLLLELGEGTLSMTSLFCLIELDVNIKIVYCLG